MSEKRTRCALTALQWTLGIVILVESILFLLPSARHDFARTHVPEVVRQLLGWGELIGAILLLIPRTVASGGWVLVGIFAFAISIHLLHGAYNVGDLAIYAAAAWAVADGKASPQIG